LTLPAGIAGMAGARVGLKVQKRREGNIVGEKKKKKKSAFSLGSLHVNPALGRHYEGKKDSGQKGNWD